MPVVSDIELFAQSTKKPIIAITGSNGKSTLVTLMGELIRNAGLKSIVCGNIGLPVLEAMTCGCPVITTRGGSLPEVAGDAALYIDPDSKESIIDGIERLFAEPKLRGELSKKGLEQSKKFSLDRVMKDLVAAYEKAYV